MTQAAWKRIIRLAVISVLSLSFLPRLSAQEWQLATDLGSGRNIAAISGLSTGEAWAVAGVTYNNPGEIYHFNMADWELQTATYSIQTGQHKGVFALDSSHVWVVGETDPSPRYGRIYFYNGSSWALQTEIISSWDVYLWDVYASDADNLCAVGNYGKIYYSSNGGTTWIIQAEIVNRTCFGIDGLDAEHIWVAGNYSPAQILFYDGDTWTTQTGIEWGSYKSMKDVTAVSSNDAWAIGGNGYILDFDGTDWTISTYIGPVYDRESISALDSGNIWASEGSGTNTGIYYCNGTSWTRQTGIAPYSLEAAPPYNVWAGAAGKIYRLQIPTPTPEPVPTTTPVSFVPPWITDFNGDGTSDIAIFRESSGLWAVRDISRVYFGTASDNPVPGDYDGDGTTEIGIFRGGSGLWALRGISRVYFGGGSDLPEAGDYDGDGTADVGIFRPATGLWAVRGVTRIYYGTTGDTPVSGYYGDGVANDIAIFRGGSGLWAIRGLTRIYFGGSTDDLVPGDYGGGGIWDEGIFRAMTGLWAIRGLTRAYFGSGTDRAVPGVYSGTGIDDVGIFRSSTGLWAVRGLTRVYFGGSGDIPVTR